METTGVMIKCTRGEFHLRSTFGCLLGDVKGLQECLSLKGASGAKPCPFCRNVLRHPTYFHGHWYWTHVRSPDARFDLHDVASFDELCTDSAAEVTAGSTIASIRATEMAYGVKYDKHAVAFCPATSRVARIPESIYPDNMHNMLASGGVMQYELNQLIRRILAIPDFITREGLDLYAASIKKPKHGITRLPPNFFVERLIDRDESHLKGYAGEVLSALAVISYFCEGVLVPNGRLLDECQCLGHAKRAPDMLTYHKVSMVDSIQDELYKHHVLFV